MTDILLQNNGQRNIYLANGSIFSKGKTMSFSAELGEKIKTMYAREVICLSEAAIVIEHVAEAVIEKAEEEIAAVAEKIKEEVTPAIEETKEVISRGRPKKIVDEAIAADTASAE